MQKMQKMQKTETKARKPRKKVLQGKALYAKVAKMNGMLIYEVEDVINALRLVVLESLKEGKNVGIEGLCDFNLKYNPSKLLVTSLFPDLQKMTKASTTVNIKTRKWLQERVKEHYNLSTETK